MDQVHVRLRVNELTIIKLHVVGLATSMLTTATIGFLFESLHLFEYKLPIIERYNEN